jgi:signal peptidase I
LSGPRPSSRRLLAELPILVVVAIAIAYGIKALIAQAFFIPSGSMIPQLEIGDRVVVSKLAYHLHDPHRGDVVVFDAPYPRPKTKENPVKRVFRGVSQSIGVAQPSTEEYIKRVIGLPGEAVEGHDGHVFVDGRELVEPYLPRGTTTTDFSRTVIPKGKLWVMGDNRGNSSDSRVFGPVRRKTVVGRAFVRIWPPLRSAFL